MNIGMVLFPRLTQLDLTGPFEVFSRMPGTNVWIVSKNLEPVRCERGLTIMPNVTFADCPEIDILFAPGGTGVNQAMQDEEIVDFVRTRGEKATWVTSVCTGSLLLATAGLLDGYKATSHWTALPLLSKFPVEVLPDRIVKDRNRVTGGGVTAGIDFALLLCSIIHGEEAAREIQLLIEYNPAPPFDSGHPATARKETLDRVVERRKKAQVERERIVSEVLKIKR